MDSYHIRTIAVHEVINFLNDLALGEPISVPQILMNASEPIN